MNFPVKVIYTVNGSDFLCRTPEQLESFLSSGWVLADEKEPKEEAPAEVEELPDVPTEETPEVAEELPEAEKPNKKSKTK